MSLNKLDEICFSIIIPAYNEANYIYETLNRIYCLIPSNINFEVIVVDNCSVDGTGDIIRSFNCDYFLMDKISNPSSVRNFGASKANGSVFIFLDADILITKKWVDELILNLPTLMTGAPLLTGSQCDISEKPNWLEKYWFAQLVTTESKYINGSNIIIHSKNFRVLHGFDSDLNTSEDVDFSDRANLNGMEVINNPGYLVHHEGYPKTFTKFIRREIWHGSSDFKSIKRFLSSKTAMAGSLLLLLLFVNILAILLALPLIATTLALAIILYCMFIVLMKFGLVSMRVFLVNTFICFFYLLGRGLSPINNYL